MRAPNSLADKLKLWEQLRGRARLVLGDVPHLAAEVARLDDELAELVALDQRHAMLTAQLRETTRHRAEAARRVRRRRNRIVATLQGHFGPESERMIEFGVPPRRRRPSRRAPAASREPSPEPDPPAEPAGA